MADDKTYSVCKHIKRKQLQQIINEDIAREIGLNYRTIPTFEKTIYERRCIEHYSLVTNELLKCRWSVYLNTLQGRTFSPFQFPDVRDLHFYQGSIRYEPSLSLHRIPDFRKKLKVGPGVDFLGQMPIPQESHFKRGKIVKEQDGCRQKILSAKTKSDSYKK